MKVEPTIKYIPINFQPPSSREVNKDTKRGQNLKDGESTRFFQIKHPVTNEMTTVGEMELIKAIERAEKALESEFICLEYNRHEPTGIMMLKILNRDTKEIIREIPPEKILDIAAAIWEMAGIIVDERI
jgi:uncharacterized FlaG/YvyC family protein